MAEPLYCTGCGREWGCGSCACPEDDSDNLRFMLGPFCHVCGVKHEGGCPLDEREPARDVASDEDAW